MDGENHANNNGNDHVHDIENEGPLDVKDAAGFYRSEFSESNMTCAEPLLRKRTNTTSQIAIVGANLSPIESLDYE